MKTTHPSKPALRQTSRRILTASIATALAVSLLPSPSAQAFDITSAANGNWNASGTWNPATVPDITKTVDVFGNTVTVTANASAQNLTVDNGGTLTLNSGVTLMTNALTIGSGPGGGSTRGTVNGSGQLMIGPGLNMNVILAGSFVGLGNTIVDYNPGGGAVASKVTIDNYFEEVGWSGNNTYTGGTDINVGGNPGPGSGVHLQLNIRGSLNCFGTGAVTLHGTSDTYALRLSMSNQGGFANQLIVHGGASLLNGSWDGNISLADASSVLATRDGITLNGVISGPGSLAIQNNTTISNASNTYTGKTSVYAGTLRIGQSNGVAGLSNVGVSGALGAPTGANATIDMYNAAAIYVGSSSPRVDQATNRTINLASNGAGTVTINVNDNDTRFTFGAVTATGTGAKTLALNTGASGNGDRESLIFNGAISDVTGDGSPLSLSVRFTTQSGSQSYVSLNAGGTFTGPITLVKGANVNSGYLTIGGVLTKDGGTPGSGQLGGGNYAGNISLDSNTIFNYYSSANQVLAGQISGVGTVMISGSGKLTLTGVNTYTGLTTVTGGTFEIGGAGQLGSGVHAAAINVSNGATFKYNSTANQELSGVLTSDGPIVKDNTGVLTLSGANVCSGSTTVNGGVLRLNNATALSTGLLNVSGGVVELASGNLLRSLGSGSGQVQVGAGSSGFSAYGAARTVTLGNTNDSVTWGSADFAPAALVLNASTANSKLTLANGLDLNGAARTITVSANTAEITGAITGAAGSNLNKTGNGKLILSGAHSYTGTTTVTGGELALNGTLQGSLTVSSGATITPLTGPGGLTTPALNLNNGSYKWLIGSSADSATLNSHIQVNGNVAITGTPTLTIDTAGGTPNPATTYELIKYTGTLSAQPAWTVDYSVINASTLKSWVDGNGTWDTANNWSGGTFSGGAVTYDNANKKIVLSGLTSGTSAPVTMSDVLINKAGGASVTGPAAPTTINSLGLGNGTDPMSLTVQSGGPLTVTGATTINQATLTTNVTMTTASVTSSGTSAVNGTGSLGTSGNPLSSFSVASGTTSFGGSVTVNTTSLAVGGTASLNTGSTVVTSGVTGAGTVNFDGGTLKAGADFTLSTGAGTIRAGGGVINANNHVVTLDQGLTHGTGPAVDGGLTVQGGGSVVVKKAQTYTGATTIQSGTTLKLEGISITPGLAVLFVQGDNSGPISQQNTFNTWLAGQQHYLTTTTVAYPSARPRLWYPDYNGHFQDLGFNSTNLPTLTNNQLSNSYSLSMNGKIKINTAGTYQFGLNSDDGSMLWIDGVNVVNDNRYQGMADQNNPQNGNQAAGSISLTAGYHDIQIGYYEGGGGHGMNVSYQGPDTAGDNGAPQTKVNGWVFVPNSVLFFASPGGSNLLPISTNVSISTGATLDLGSADQQIASLTGPTGAIVTNSGITNVTLTISGSGNTTFSGLIQDGATNKISLVKSGSGTQTLAGANTYTGATTVTGGVLRLNNANALPGGIGMAGGTSNLTLNGGVIGLGAGDFTRALGTTGAQVQFTGDGGFAAYTANRAVNIGGASATVTWNSGSFVPTGNKLILGASTADMTVDFQNPIALGGANRTVQVDDGSATIDGKLTGTITTTGGGLVKTGTGTLNLDGLQQYDLLQVTASAGVTNLNNTLGTAPGLAILNANSTTNITVSQDLLELNIGTNPPLAGFGGGSGPAVGVVPEPGSIGLLLTGALGLLGRRRGRSSRE